MFPLHRKTMRQPRAPATTDRDDTAGLSFRRFLNFDGPVEYDVGLLHEALRRGKVDSQPFDRTLELAESDVHRMRILGYDFSIR